jgi:hypothetical protein
LAAFITNIAESNFREVVALFRPQHDRYHVVADERADLPRLLLSQAFAFFLDLRMPTVIWVGRRLSIGTGCRTGSRT